MFYRLWFEFLLAINIKTFVSNLKVCFPRNINFIIKLKLWWETTSSRWTSNLSIEYTTKIITFSQEHNPSYSWIWFFWIYSKILFLYSANTYSLSYWFLIIYNNACYILFSNPAYMMKILQHNLEIKCSYLYLSTKLNGKNDFDSSFIISSRLFFRSAFKIGNITSHLIWVYHPCGNTSNII